MLETAMLQAQITDLSNRIYDRDQELLRLREELARLKAPRDTAERACQTPETYYEIGLDTDRTLSIRLRFPFSIEFWAKGTWDIREQEAAGPDGMRSDSEKLRIYDLRAAERERISAMIHDALEPVGADAYRAMRLVDERLGTDHVDRGIAVSRRLRTRRGC